MDRAAYKILIIEDDPVIRSELYTLLAGHGYQPIATADFTSVADRVRADMPHLVLLDISLPTDSGFSICSKIRAFSNIPIIFVTASDSDMDELNGLLLGGDAFVTKPYHPAILLAKITSLLKRAYPSAGNEALVWREAVLHVERSAVSFQNQTAELTKNELRILYYLFRHAGSICPRGDIIDYLWDNQLYVDDNALSVNISRLREKLSAIGLTDFIKTRHRQGYQI